MERETGFEYKVEVTPGFPLDVFLAKSQEDAERIAQERAKEHGYAGKKYRVRKYYRKPYRRRWRG